MISVLIINLLLFMHVLTYASPPNANVLFNDFSFTYTNQLSEFFSNAYIDAELKSSYKIGHGNVGNILFKTSFNKNKVALSYNCIGHSKYLIIEGASTSNPSLYEFYDNLEFKNKVKISYSSQSFRVELFYERDQSLFVQKSTAQQSTEFLLKSTKQKVKYKKWINQQLKYSLEKYCSKTCSYTENSKPVVRYEDLALTFESEFESKLKELFNEILLDFTICY